MRAMTYARYGGPDVLTMAELPDPRPGPGQVLIQVQASSVTTGDWRLRAAAFPGILQIPGRLMFGLRRPRNPVLGGDFVGLVRRVGTGVTRFAPGQAVFGFAGHGAHAEQLVMSEDAALAPLPKGLSPAQAAALPFGGLAALVFLRDVAPVQPGQSVLIVGASGGVGCYAVQIAKAMGAEVTGVAGAHAPLVATLGADHVVDYRQQDITRMTGPYDVILDCVGALRFGQARRMLRRNGQFVPLNFGLREMAQALIARLQGGPQLRIAVNGDSARDLSELSQMVSSGQLCPVIDRRFAFDQLPAAHAHVETRHRAGAVIIDMAEPAGQSAP